MLLILKNVGAVIAGILVGSIVNMAIISVGPLLIPLPDGVDMNDMDQFAENLKKLEPVNFLVPWLAHAVGTLAGSWLTVKLAASVRFALAMVIGFFFLLGGLAMVMIYRGPIWFCVADLVAAYLPMAYLGHKLARPTEKPLTNPG